MAVANLLRSLLCFQIMPLDLGKAKKPVRELGKSLDSLHGNPSIKAVHNLRTGSRRLEAIVLALDCDRSQSVRRLLKNVKVLRKAAGQVRDMDVLARKALSLADLCGHDSVERLLKQLRAMRTESAQRLAEAVREQRKKTQHGLDRFSNRLETELKNGNRHSDQVKRLVNDLIEWPTLGADNLHAFRNKVKELRYILQLADAAPEFLKILDGVKARAGDWHDWKQMTNIARQTLNRRKDQKALEKIAEIEKVKFQRALKAAQTLRMRYLGGQNACLNVEP
jgi:CHAD domain-containing protein